MSGLLNTRHTPLAKSLSASKHLTPIIECQTTHDFSDLSYLTVYTALVGVGTVFSAFCVFYYVFGSIRAARIIHEKLVVSILGTTLR